MKTKQLAQCEVAGIANAIKDWLNMYSPQVTILQVNNHQVIWREEQNGSVNKWNNTVYNITINSSRGNFERLMDFHPLLDRGSVAREITKEFFDEVDKDNLCISTMAH
ncbi:MAG: hypothetical protein A3D67_02470 [Candidatus Lloydbacteria bacterium RIFCSPHIGHO2_02_FULL_51_22]|uniref:Uncharacterized protein n=2 Tax=Candidatus Lloydiibacteriota TaxID=1817910 RepID=A0A1G2DEP0_9BACT|nr:MAG: hypothetical protein A3D67_02470 [Candidatus Lloydbacteria bacterium RIFCSPHIGHO2_02_FULL_51_22]OGZ15899.1 MAG: hypothetical protein A3G11_02275 [Candidatus Lloydbacteria bacterium RIFCSPLOWO2_12_FULL_51_9]